MARAIIILGIAVMICILVIPTLIVQFIPKETPKEQTKEVKLNKTPEKNSPTIFIKVYRTKLETVETVPLETYIRGVIAAEMPPNFEIEALKAQALAARTYIIRRLIEKNFKDVPQGAMVTDTIKHQVYKNEQELKKKWGADYEKNIAKINQAVNETIGKVITYNGRPINATFFSTSNGHTENSEEYWGAVVPYLKSVESPWDTISPRYEDETVFKIDQFQQRLGVQLAAPVSTGETANLIDVKSRTTGNRVKKVKIGDKVFTGREVREALQLPSSHFNIELDDQFVVIHTKGWGHGVGMSQWGANGMAKEGYQAEEIVRHYYKNTRVEDYREWIVQKPSSDS